MRAIFKLIYFVFIVGIFIIGIRFISNSIEFSITSEDGIDVTDSLVEDFSNKFNNFIEELDENLDNIKEITIKTYDDKDTTEVDSTKKLTPNLNFKKKDTNTKTEESEEDMWYNSDDDF